MKIKSIFRPAKCSLNAVMGSTRTTATFLGTAALAALTALSPLPASAAVVIPAPENVRINFDVTLNPGLISGSLSDIVDVTNFNAPCFNGGCPQYWAQPIFGSWQLSDLYAQSTPSQNRYAHLSFQDEVPVRSPADTTLVLGLLQTNLPGDPNGIITDHVIALVNPLAASSAIGKGFDSVFSISEAQMAFDLKELASNDYFADPVSWWNANQDLLYGVGSSGELFTPRPGPFTVVAFSTGQEIGTGSTTVEPVPEPATIMLFGVGIAGFGLVRRRLS